ncbi:MAG TPA: SET domain-containing protein-lysine N-methyltransferase [Bryobacteraceae bacterium]|nr:SET domain-containing protein-lysine N-methyltransferase [Bryobacteraceae bacterium]
MARSPNAKEAVSPNGKSEVHQNGNPRIDDDYACFGMRLARSRIHRWGVFATEFIPARRKVIEYTGEKINRRETKRRADEREFTYLFTLNPYWTIDGAVGGSGAEYINHSCDPNLVSRIVRGHILYLSLRDIKPGEELTIDYRFDKKVERVLCRCGTTKCRGTINILE